MTTSLENFTRSEWSAARMSHRKVLYETWNKSNHGAKRHLSLTVCTVQSAGKSQGKADLLTSSGELADKKTSMLEPSIGDVAGSSGPQVPHQRVKRPATGDTLQARQPPSKKKKSWVLVLSRVTQPLWRWHLLWMFLWVGQAHFIYGQSGLDNEEKVS